LDKKILSELLHGHYNNNRRFWSQVKARKKLIYMCNLLDIDCPQSIDLISKNIFDDKMYEIEIKTKDK
jgi:hypothetical protein